MIASWRRFRPSRRSVALVALFVVQIVCAMVFAYDLLRSVLGFGGAPINWQVREFIEIGAALGLLLGVAATAALLLQSRRRAADAEARLKELSTAFAALVADRFERWGLTRAEKDVAWFSIKGLGIAEIAALRQTSEGTVKAQLNAIYRKSGVSSRAELLSLFLDDLLAGADSAPMHKPLAAAAE